MVAGALALTLVLPRILVATRAGLILQAILRRSNTGALSRLQGRSLSAILFFGLGGMAGIAGVLYVVVAQFASRTFMDLTFPSPWWCGQTGALAGLPRGRRLPRLAAKLFPYLMQNLERPGGLLSGGQQQQLAITRALAAEPSMLLLDEPIEGIQPNLVEEIEDVIISLNREARLTIVFVEQNVAFARRAGQHFAMMEKGRVVAEGAISELTDELVHRHLVV